VRAPIRVEADGSFRIESRLYGTEATLLVGRRKPRSLREGRGRGRSTGPCLRWVGLKPSFALVLVDIASADAAARQVQAPRLEQCRTFSVQNVPIAGGYTLGQIVPGAALGDARQFAAPQSPQSKHRGHRLCHCEIGTRRAVWPHGCRSSAGSRHSVRHSPIRKQRSRSRGRAPQVSSTSDRIPAMGQRRASGFSRLHFSSSASPYALGMQHLMRPSLWRGSTFIHGLRGHDADGFLEGSAT